MHPQSEEKPSTCSASHVEILSLPCQRKHPCLPLHPSTYAQKGLCLPTLSPANQMWVWVMAGQGQEARGIFNLQLGPCRLPTCPANFLLTTVPQKSSFRGNRSLNSSSCRKSPDLKKVPHFGRFCCANPTALYSLLHCCFRSKSMEWGRQDSYSNYVHYRKHV